MGVVTVQLGQCGNQLGDALFQTLAAEFESADYGQDAVEQFFRPLAKPLVTRAGVKTCAARSVMIDMEPKVIHAARAAAAASPSFWSYADAGCFFAQSGAGNNWAQGFHRFGPKVRDEALDLVRREVEAADLLDGFFLLQSMAGGTGAGFGTYVAEALRDEYGGAHMMNCCVWPYDSGEVSVQSYNTLLTLSHLAEASDGVVLMANDALHQTCVKLHGIQRPGFNDMNAVAARALAGFMLPASHRPLAPAPLAAQPQPPTPPTLPFHPLADALAHLCGHPGYRLLTLRSVPSVPAAHVDFTTFTWPAILKRLRAMCGAASAVEEGFGAGALDTAAAGTSEKCDAGCWCFDVPALCTPAYKWLLPARRDPEPACSCLPCSREMQS